VNGLSAQKSLAKTVSTAIDPKTKVSPAVLLIRISSFEWVMIASTIKGDLESNRPVAPKNGFTGVFLALQ
jgi:hypothetical protein